MADKFNLKSIKPSPFDARDMAFHLSTAVSYEQPLPATLASPVLPPVKNQGYFGSCVGMATASAIEYAIAFRAKNPVVPVKPKETWFRAIVTNTNNKPISKPLVQIDNAFIVLGTEGGVLAAQIPKSIIDKGKVPVIVSAPGKKIVQLNIDFRDDQVVSRHVRLAALRSGLPSTVEVIPTKTRSLWDSFLEVVLDFVNWIDGLISPKPFGVNEVVDFSGKFVYSECKKLDGEFRDTGTFPRQACKVVAGTGIVREKDCPYVAPVPEDFPEQTEVALYQLALANKIKTYRRIYTQDEVKRSLANGMGVVFACSDASLLVGLRSLDFPKYVKQPGWSGHAMCFVSYDEIGFGVKNSWGLNWGQKGYARIPYASNWWAQGAIFEMWAIQI